MMTKAAGFAAVAWADLLGGVGSYGRDDESSPTPRAGSL